jgi:hypothetical protein
MGFAACQATAKSYINSFGSFLLLPDHNFPMEPHSAVIQDDIQISYLFWYFMIESESITESHNLGKCPSWLVLRCSYIIRLISNIIYTIDVNLTSTVQKTQLQTQSSDLHFKMIAKTLPVFAALLALVCGSPTLLYV